MAIIIIEPASSGNSLIKASITLGYEVIIISSLTLDSEKCEETWRYAKQIIKCCIYNKPKIISQLHEISGNNSIDAIIPGCEYAVSIAATLARKFNVLGLNTEAKNWCRNKYKMRKRLEEIAIPSTAFHKIKTASDIKKAVDKIGFPGVLKPIDATGSLKVIKINNKDEFTNNYKKLSRLKICDLGKKIDSHMIYEKYISGPEFSIEGYITSNNDVQIVSVTKKILSKEPYFAEVGHIVGVKLSRHNKNKIHEYVKNIIQALKINLGVFHMEVRLTEKGPIIIEVASRLGGDKIYRLVEDTYGVDLPLIMVKSYLGLEINPDKIKKKQPHKNGIYFIPPYANFNKVKKKLSNTEEIVAINDYKATGYMQDTVTDFRGRIGEIIFRVRSGQEDSTLLSDIIDTFASNQITSIGIKS